MNTQIWNNYRVERHPVGKGKKGNIFRGYDAINKRDVAIKRMKDIEGARKEAAIMKEYSRHDFLPTYYDFFIDERYAYIVMEWIEGKSMKKNKKKLKSKQALTFTLKILDGLHHLHKSGSVHSDLHRGNIMLLAPNYKSLKIIDFGNGKLIENKAHKYPHDLSWKQVKDQSRDLYRAAALCVYMLTGKRPQNERDIQDITIKNKELRNVLVKALSIEKANRYQTAQEFKQALEPFLNK